MAEQSEHNYVIIYMLNFFSQQGTQQGFSDLVLFFDQNNTGGSM
jgi:hypothetical protein